MAKKAPRRARSRKHLLVEALFGKLPPKSKRPSVLKFGYAVAGVPKSVQAERLAVLNLIMGKGTAEAA